jgi:hypothetical protein
MFKVNYLNLIIQTISVGITISLIGKIIMDFSLKNTNKKKEPYKYSFIFFFIGVFIHLLFEYNNINDFTKHKRLIFKIKNFKFNDL